MCTGIALPLCELPTALLEDPALTPRIYDRSGHQEVQFHWWQSPTFLPVRWLLRHRFESIARAPGIRAPLLTIAGERDEIIPPERSRRLYEAWGGPKRWVVIPEANHDGLGRQRAFWEPIGAFLDAARAGG